MATMEPSPRSVLPLGYHVPPAAGRSRLWIIIVVVAAVIGGTFVAMLGLMFYYRSARSAELAARMSRPTAVPAPARVRASTRMNVTGFAPDILDNRNAQEA